MTQTGAPIKRQPKNHDGLSRILSEPPQGSKDVSHSSPKQPTLRDVYLKHDEIVTSFFEEGDLDLGKYRSVLFEVDRDKRNLIHTTINKLKTDYKDVESEWQGTPIKALDLVETLVVERPGLLVEKDVQNTMPLRLAAEAPIEAFFRVTNLVIPTTLHQALRTKCQKDKMNCPLREVSTRLLAHCPKVIPDDADNDPQRKSPDPTETKEVLQVEKASTEHCLHNEINVNKLLDSVSRPRNILSKNLGSCLQLLMDVTNFDPNLKGGFLTVSQESFNHLLSLCPNDVFKSTAGDGYTPLHLAVRLYDTKDQHVDYERLFGIINALVCRAPSSIYAKAGVKADGDYGKTVYDLLKDLGKDDPECDIVENYDSGTEQSKWSPRLLSLRKTEELLKKICTGSSMTTPNGKVAFLYKDAKLSQYESSVRRKQCYNSHLTLGQSMIFSLTSAVNRQFLTRIISSR